MSVSSYFGTEDYSGDGFNGLSNTGYSVLDAFKISVDTTGLDKFTSYFGGDYGGDGFKGVGSSGYDRPAESYSGPMSLGWDGSGATKDERSFFERMGDGLVSAAEKDPLRVAQAGLGALYGAYKDMKTDKQLKAQYDLYASRIAAEKEAKDQYNASFGGAGKARGSTKGPATRVNGQRIYNDNGTMKRG